MRIPPLILVPLLLGLSLSVLAVDPPPPPPPDGGGGGGGGGGGSNTSSVSNTQVLYAVRVDPQKRKILVFCMDADGRLKLNSIRDFTYDLILDELPLQKKALTTAQVREQIEKSHPDFKKEKADFEKANKGKKFDAEDWLKGGKSPLIAPESVSLITTQGVTTWGGTKEPALCTSIYHSGYFYILDEANKKILAYQIQGGKLVLVSVRKWEYDDRLEPYDKKLKMPTSADFDGFLSILEVKKEVLEQEKKKKEEEEKEKEKDKK